MAVAEKHSERFRSRNVSIIAKGAGTEGGRGKNGNFMEGNSQPSKVVKRGAFHLLDSHNDITPGSIRMEGEVETFPRRFV
ncbi:hypothetical protein AW736_26685 [Termitidicoccus mucosus]|uniref:Uncharacterized protein n=1 Tax=Termitidicoccus mucosus TaxID=1184151 RepID=A0A178IM37_9BACT|nr:hypothetical protein AW736_08220 [Opitutaceae bacterium TSB47]OAM91849.1 hypothetical protein AW736_26685 [Opitutaceae bacterium TSB47]